MKLRHKIFASSIGTLHLVADETYLHAVLFEDGWQAYQTKNEDILDGSNAVIKKTIQQLDEYFAGKRKSFDVSYALQGTELQKRAWKSLLKVPYGQTSTYKKQATLAGSPEAVRAIGHMNGVNQLCIILPCHRIIGTNGNLTGYAGGLAAKKALLQLERNTLNMGVPH